MIPWVVFRKFLPYGLIIAALMGAYFYIRWDAYNDGVRDTTARYEIAIQEERDRLQEANRQALNQARIIEAELNRLLRDRNATISQLMEEGRADPDADRPAISSDGVRRINRIR